MGSVIAGEPDVCISSKTKGGASNLYCFYFLCSKRHQCPVHHGPVGEAMFHQSNLGQPQTEYRLIYCSTAGNTRSYDAPTLQKNHKRGIKLHPKILPAPPKSKVESSTTYVRAFPDPGYQKMRDNLKPDDTYIKTDSRFQDETSYNVDFFDRSQHAEAEAAKPPPSPETYKELTLPTIVNCSLHYETTNEKFFPNWKNTRQCRLKPYGEPFIKPLFAGQFNDETVTKREFYKKSTRPRTCYIPTDGKLYGGGKFEDFTVTKDTFLPKIIERDMPFLRHNSLKNIESVEPIKAGKMQNITQYRRDNLPLLHQPPKRKLCRPEADKIISLSNGFNLPLITMQSTAFPHWGKVEVPALLKREDQTERLVGPFQKRTHYVDHYKPISLPRPRVKRQEDTPFVYHHQRIPFPISVNQSEYFKFKTVRPRRLHGDKAELKVFRGPPKVKFGCNTHYQDFFPGVTGMRPKDFKPIDAKIIDIGKLSESTSYKDHFPKRELSIKQICPAELVLASFC